MAPSHEHHGVSHDEHAGHQHGAAATTTLGPRARRDGRCARCARGDGSRRSRRSRWVDGGHGPRHAQPVRRGGGVVGGRAAVVADRARRAARRCAGAVAVAVGAGWLYSVVVTLTGGGEVFYEAATVLTTFVLLGHWLEMRARGGANEALRTPLQLAPPRAVVLRDGEAVEVPTDEVKVGHLFLIRPGANRHRRRARTWRSRRRRARDRPQGAPEPRLGDRPTPWPCPSPRAPCRPGSGCGCAPRSPP